MSNPNQPVRIKLTAEQKELIWKVTGMKAEALELTAEELEQRIAPVRIAPAK